MIGDSQWPGPMQEVSQVQATFQISSDWKEGLEKEEDIGKVLEQANGSIRNLSPKSMSNTLKQFASAACLQVCGSS